MTVIKINALTVPAEMGEEVARRFAARAGAVDGHDGFEGFELLRPTDERTTWLVVTRWRDTRVVRGVANVVLVRARSSRRAIRRAWRWCRRTAGRQPPMPIQAELWSFDVAISSAP